MQTVIGLFENAEKAQEAAQQLMSKGFTSDNVDISTRSTSSAAGSYADEPAPVSVYQDNLSSDTSMNASSTGTLNYPATATPSSSSHPSNYDGATEEGDGFGEKVSKFFSNLFGSDDDEAERYATAAKKTGNVVTVHAQSTEEAEKAADILDDYGAIDINQEGTEYGYATPLDTPTDEDASISEDFGNTVKYGSDENYGSTATLPNGATLGTDVNYGSDDESQKLNVIKEDINIGKKEIETGGVRLRSRIVARPVEEQLRLKEEKVTVQRTPVDRPATTADFQNFKEGVIEMTEYAEVPEVTKEARIVEEVRLAKEVNERTENIKETAYDTEVEVENIPASTTYNDVANKQNF